MNQHLLLRAPSAVTKPLLSEADRIVFLEEAKALFARRRQGHMIHRMYMTPEALRFWSEFMKHDGYYVTRSELQLIKDNAASIGELAKHPDGIIGIENGPGTDSAMLNKSAVFFSAMPDLHTMLARDWSGAVTGQVEKVLTPLLPGVRIIPDLSNFLQAALPRGLGQGRKVMAEFGVTRGNMEGFPADGFPFDVLRADLAFHRNQLEPDDLYIVTFDANQDEDSIVYAYTSHWLTEWGRQLFRTMESELPIEGDFDPEAFVFRPIWHGASYISTNNMVATRNLRFKIGGERFSVRAGEAFGITNSYKTPVALFNGVATSCGFEVAALCSCPQGRMVMPVLRAVTGRGVAQAPGRPLNL